MGPGIFLWEELNSEPFFQINKIPVNMIEIEICDEIKRSPWRKKWFLT